MLPSALILFPAALVAPSIALVFLPFMDAVLALALGLLLTAIILAILFVKSPVIEIYEQDGNRFLSVADAAIHTRLLDKTTKIAAAEASSEMGSKLDGRAWLINQMGVRSLLKVELNDPSDQTPYWLFSTRRATRIEEVLKTKG